MQHTLSQAASSARAVKNVQIVRAFTCSEIAFAQALMPVRKGRLPLLSNAALH